MPKDRKFEVWLDSGANIHSEYKTHVSLSDFGINSEEWDALTDDERDELMRDIAFGNADWGFKEVDTGE